MKLKRVTAVLLAGVMAMGLVACGSGSDTAPLQQLILLMTVNLQIFLDLLMLPSI